jgi:hypothetical protein
MSSKHLRISSFGENHVSSAYLAQIVESSRPIKHKKWIRKLVSFVRAGRPQLLLKKKGETNLHHLRQFMLFTSQNALLVQLRFMSSKHIPVSLFGESHVSSTYLEQIVCRSTNQI